MFVWDFQLLDDLNNDPDLLTRVTTSDERWIYSYIVKIKDQPFQQSQDRENSVKCKGFVLCFFFRIEWRDTSEMVSFILFFDYNVRSLSNIILSCTMFTWSNTMKTLGFMSNQWLLRYNNISADTSLLVREFGQKQYHNYSSAIVFIRFGSQRLFSIPYRCKGENFE